uniref:Uncharacterized protein n=1 Tax=Ditylenchus dipsaci TaxID=166011 RepID=A0A915CM69_9BILA
MDYWDSSRGIAQIPFSKLPERLDGLLEGAFMDIYTLPTHLKDLYDARGAKGQQGLIPLPATAGAGLLQPIQLQCSHKECYNKSSLQDFHYQPTCFRFNSRGGNRTRNEFVFDNPSKSILISSHNQSSIGHSKNH